MPPLARRTVTADMGAPAEGHTGTTPGAKVRADVAQGLLVNDLTGVSLPLIVDEWTELRFMVDLEQDWVAIYYNNVLLDTHPWTIRAGSLQVAAVHPLNFPPGLVYWDDISVHPVRLFSTDCNENGIPDDCDIAHGPSEDANGNNVPDSCEAADPPAPTGQTA